jgi:hypothetical protein
VRALLLIALFAPPLLAAEDKNPKNDPETCPYCHGDPEVMAKGGVVSHGGFEFGRTDTDGVDRLLANDDLRWIETEHFEIGFGGAPYRVAGTEKKPLQAELTELALLFPEVNPKTKSLDPWLRAHMYAFRVERIWDRFIDVLEVDTETLPDGIHRWDGRGDYRGEGPYMGQKGKYEVLIVPGEGDLVAYLTDQFGLHTKMTNRWNIMERDTIAVTIQLHHADLKKDLALHGHVAFNLAHNMLDGYEHYSYETPIWIHEGLAHYFERLISPKYNSFDSGEGSVAVGTSKSNWDTEVRKLVRAKKVPRMAELIALRSYAELTLADHFTTWSMVKFLVEEHKSGFAALNRELHGRMMADGTLDSQNLPGVHREAFKRDLDMSYAEFDEAWRNWVLGIVPEEEVEE